MKLFYPSTVILTDIWDNVEASAADGFQFTAWMYTYIVKVILYSYLILKKMNERITDN